MKTLFVISLLLFSGASFADCRHNGRSYPEGTVLGPMVCSGGSWQQR